MNIIQRQIFKLYGWFGLLSAWFFKKAFIGETGDIKRGWGFLARITAKISGWLFVKWISPGVRRWKRENQIYSLEYLLKWNESQQGIETNETEGPGL